MPLLIALNILGKMSLEGHIDPDLFNIFIQQKTYLRYARQHLSAEQIDDVDITTLPGYLN